MKNNIKVFAAIVTGLVGGLFSSAVLAQNEAASDESIFEEVIVTATKRAESIYDVPMAVSAFTEEAIRQVRAQHDRDRFLSGPHVIN
jgi:iron complex outermembrane receptor protein